MIGGAAIKTFTLSITPYGRETIGGISLVLGKPPITRFLWVCGQRSYYGADRADRRFRGLERDKPAEEARKRRGNATVEGLGTLPPALKLTRSLERE